MTLFARKQYYLSLWAFLELKSLYIYYKKKTDVKVKEFYLHNNYVQCILGIFQYVELQKEGPQCSRFCKHFANNFVDIQQKNMHLLCFCAKQDVIQ